MLRTAATDRRHEMLSQHNDRSALQRVAAMLRRSAAAAAAQGCNPKKEVGGRLKQDLDKDFLNNLGLHTRTLIHVRKIAIADYQSS